MRAKHTPRPKASAKKRAVSDPKTQKAAANGVPSAGVAKERLQHLLHGKDEVQGVGAAAAAPEGAAEQRVYPVVVYTAEELKAAQEAHSERIVVKGELARKLETALKGLGSLSATSLNALALCLSGAALFAPFTGGVSLGAAGTVMGTVGAALTATAIAAISAIGLSLVLAVFRGYDEIKLAGGGLELSLKKHKGKGAEKGTGAGAEVSSEPEAAPSGSVGKE